MHEQDPSQEIAGQITDSAKNIPKSFLGRLVKGKSSRAAKRLFAKGIKAAGKALLKALSVLLAKFGIVLLIIGLIILVIMGAYFLIMEFRGPEQSYSTEYQNTTIEEEGTTIISLSEENNAILEFYRYFSDKAYVQIIDDSEEFITVDDAEYVKDYYDKEESLSLSSNLLLGLDEHIYRGDFKYPEQFIQPVHADLTEMQLLPLTDEDHFVTAQSMSYKPNGDSDGMVNSVRGYGFGSIFKYTSGETKTYLKGTYVGIEEWDSSTESVTIKVIDEPFSFEYKPPQSVNIMINAVTISGAYEFVYEDVMALVTPARSGATIDENQNYQKIYYDTICTEYRTVEVPPYIVDDVVITEGYEYEECANNVDLHKIRSIDSGIYEERPVLKDTIYGDPSIEDKEEREEAEKEKSERYIKDYLNNFEAHIPIDAIEKFDFSSRVGVLMDDLNVGENTSSKEMRGAKKYKDTVNSLCQKWGFPDSDIILAIIAYETAGNIKYSENGLMNVPVDTITGIDASGKKTTLYGDKTSAELGIEIGIVYLKSLYDKYEDMMKAIQAYQITSGPVDWIASTFPSQFETLEWLEYREIANDEFPNQPLLDDKYLEKVLDYYQGSAFDEMKEHMRPEEVEEGVFTKLFSIFLVERADDEPIPNSFYKYPANNQIVNDIMQFAASMDLGTYFSETEATELSLFNNDIGRLLGSVNISFEEFSSMVPNADGYVRPVNQEDLDLHVTSPYGIRTHPITKVKGFHAGIDIAFPEGEPIYAVSSGVVEIAKDGGSYGNYIKLTHDDGNQSLYAHLAHARRFGFSTDFVVEAGERVETGQLIGFMGSTGRSSGSHLHFEFFVDGERINPYYMAVGN